MCHLRHWLRNFLFCRKVMFCFQDIQFFCIFNHPTIYQVCQVINVCHCTCGDRTPKQCFVTTACDSKWYDTILWRVISVKLNIDFVRRYYWCVYFQILYNTMDFYERKLNLTWSYKWIIYKGISEQTCWSVGVWLTPHIKFCMCNDSTPK